jgi:CRISPR-associated protein Csm4
MKIIKFIVQPLTAFATPFAGDTLFGHLCWAIRERDGEDRLDELLHGYTAGAPFLVTSDGFPEGYVPRPTAPDFVLGLNTEPSERKRARTHRWLPTASARQPLSRWMKKVSRSDMAHPFVVTQNTINRLTGTTGTGPFAPRQVERTWFDEGARLELYAVLDERRLSEQALHGIIEDVGLRGYGRDATTGVGKFAVTASSEQHWPVEPTRNWLTLAPCAPDPTVLDAEHCYYLPITRFGRHGNLAVNLGNPFKSPVLMAGTGALLRSREPGRWTFHGRGLGGRDDPISAVMPGTVQQGYAPVFPITLQVAA